MTDNETRLIKQSVGELQHLRPSVHPRVQQKIVSGDEEEDSGNARFDDILEDPLRFYILCAEDFKGRPHEAL